MAKKTIFVGADHAGFPLKEALKPELAKLGYKVEDKGATRLELTDDYPDFGAAVAREVSDGKGIGLLACGSAQGVSIVANKFPGVRAVAVMSPEDAKLTREHNDANVLCLSGWNTPPAKAKAIAKVFLGTAASKEARHRRRVGKIAAIERKTMKPARKR